MIPGFAAPPSGCRPAKRPWSFPYGFAQQLRHLGVKVKLKEGSFFPERQRKSAPEVKKISAALVMAEVGMAEGMQALKTASYTIVAGGRQACDPHEPGSSLGGVRLEDVALVTKASPRNLTKFEKVLEV